MRLTISQPTITYTVTGLFINSGSALYPKVIVVLGLEF